MASARRLAPPPQNLRSERELALPAPGGLGGALGNFFGTPRKLPPVTERVAQALARIDWTKRDIVLWLPGTNEWAVSPAFQQALQGVFGTKAVPLVYEASWRFSTSLDDGQAVLRGVLEAIAKRKGKHRVFLAGQSQGAWIIGNVISEPRYASVVTRAALFGHPSFGEMHAHRPNSKVLEINNPGDPVVHPLNGSDDRVLSIIEDIARGNFLRNILPFLGVALSNGPALGAILGAQINHWLGGRDPHNYNLDMLTGVVFLNSGRRVGRAARPHDQDGITPA